MIVAIAALPGAQIEFDVRGLPGGDRERVDRLWRQGSAAQVRVQHGSGEIEDTSLERLRLPVHLDRDAIDQSVIARVDGVPGGDHRAPSLAEDAANGTGHDRPAALLDEAFDARVPDQAIDRRQLATHGDILVGG
jgi:hypothetical protein